MVSEYKHEGWVGVPYESDFQARWGLIKREEMLDCWDAVSLVELKERTLAAGLEYAIYHKKSKYGSRLYRVARVAPPRCVESFLRQRERNTKAAHARYRGSAETRMVQRFRNAEQVAKKRGTPFDIELNDILARMQAGYCEATGVAFDLDGVNNPYTPSLDQIVPSAGYTKNNVRLVCAAYNLMKNDFAAEDIDHFLDAIVETRRNGARNIKK